MNKTTKIQNILFMKTGNFLLTLCTPLILFSSAVSADPEIEKGKEIYNGGGACMTCHGMEGAGDGPASAALNPKPASFQLGNYRIDATGDGKTGTEQDLYQIITHGAQKFGGSMMMVGRSDLSESDRNALVKYVLSLKK
jgi:mono/diheme cytochrome c family protein